MNSIEIVQEERKKLERKLREFRQRFRAIFLGFCFIQYLSSRAHNDILTLSIFGLFVVFLLASTVHFAVLLGKRMMLAQLSQRFTQEEPQTLTNDEILHAINPDGNDVPITFTQNKPDLDGLAAFLQESMDKTGIGEEFGDKPPKNL